MASGAFAPLPLRLSPETLSAAQHARLCADLVAAKRSTPIAVLRVSTLADGRVVEWYSGANGFGPAFAPTAADFSTAVILTWPATYTGEDGRVYTWKITSAQAFVGSGTVSPNAVPTAVVTGPTDLRVQGTDPVAATRVDCGFTVVVYGSASPVIADYGGSPDKTDNETERTPYAAQFYRTIQDSRGSAYSKDLTGLVHAENLCLARHYGWAQRLVEKWGCETNPGTAETKLDVWCALLDVLVRADDTPADLRAKAVASYRAMQGPTRQNVDDSISVLLAPWYQRTLRQWTDYTTPAPAITYWPTANPGPSAWDIGPGTWLSERCNLVVDVSRPADADLSTFLVRVNTDLVRLLDKLLPAHWTYDWAIEADLGFRLDYDQLDFHGWGPS